MPASSPKKHEDPDDPTRPRTTYKNRRRIKRVIIWVTVLGFAGIIIGWSLLATWPDVRPGDTVRIKYGIWAVDGSYIEGSDDLTVYVDLDSTPHVIYFEMAHAKVGVQQNFAVAACPSPPCEDFGGFTSGPHAWQAIKGNVTVLEILGH